MPDLPPPAGDPGADPEPELHELELHEPALHEPALRTRVVDLEQLQREGGVPKPGDAVALDDGTVVVAASDPAPELGGKLHPCRCLVGTPGGWEEGGPDVERGHENGCFTNLHPVERWPAAGFGGEALDEARAEALARRSDDDRGKRPSVS